MWPKVKTTALNRNPALFGSPSRHKRQLSEKRIREANEEKEKKRKKQGRKMGKIISKLWDLDPAFQSSEKNDDEEKVTCLTHLGQKIDQKAYRLGRHGWEDFARDLGGVYNRHIRGYVV